MLVAVGALFALAGALVMIFAILFWFDAPRDRLHRLGVPVFIVLAIFGGIASYGCALVVRGVRGRSRPRFARAETWYRRNSYVIGLVGWGILTGIGMIIAGGPRAVLLGRDATPSRLAWHVLLLFVVLPIHVTVHELGHAAAGALVGFRFASLRIGWVVLRREAGRLHVSWSRSSIAGVLGFHVGVPEGSEMLGARLGLHAAAGPAATVALAAACHAGATALGPAATLASGIGSDLLFAAWWAGLLLGGVNLLPFQTGSGFSTDGARILMALRPRSPGANTVMRASLLSLQGRRPRDWGMSADSILRTADDERRFRAALRHEFPRPRRNARAAPRE